MAVIKHTQENRDITNIASAGTLYQPLCNCYILTVKDASPSPIDLRGEDDASTDGNGAYVRETVEAIVSELNPLAYFTADANTGVMHLVMDKDTTDAGELRTRIRRIGATTTVTVKTAGSFVVGDEYTITEAGNTNFTLVGAADNAPGTVFTATGVGSGTGTATATDRVTSIGPNSIDISGSTVVAGSSITVA
jgi:hypothetical protein